MRELIYLSDSKLEQFLPELRSLWPRPKLSLKTPFAGVEVDPTPDARKSRLQHLAKVTAQIKRSAEWFAAPDLGPGQWVAFQAPLNYVILPEALGRMLVFIDPGRAVSGYPGGESVRLLLHGSSRHLIGGPPPRQAKVPEGENAYYEYTGFGSSAMPGYYHAVKNVEVLLRAFYGNIDFERDVSESPEKARDHLPRGTQLLAAAIDKQVHPKMAAWMAGYARVTISVSIPRARNPRLFRRGLDPDDLVRYVVASPLYVEYASAPA
jgi:hypothetical protein